MSLKLVGFWYSRSEPELPFPAASTTPVDPEFLLKLFALEARLMEKYAANVAAWNNAVMQRTKEPELITEVVGYRGWSNCRLCNHCNGSREFRFGGFAWPEGYRHYLKIHNVQPDPEFAAFILSDAAQSQ